MKIIYRYLIKNFLAPFVLTFFFAVFILLMQYLWRYVDDLAGKGLELKYIVELLFYAALTMIPMSAPLAILLSSLITFGNMGERYEIVAMKSAGIPLQKLMIPLAILALFIASLAFISSNWIVPKSYVKMKSLLVDIQEKKPALNIEAGTFYSGFDNYIIRIGKKHKNNEDIEDVLIYDHSRNQGNTTVTYAESGSMKMTPDKHYLLFTLHNGFFWDESRNESRGSTQSGSLYPLTRAAFKEQYKRFDLSSFNMQKSDDSFFATANQALSINELSRQIDTIKNQIHRTFDDKTISAFDNVYFFNLFVRPIDTLPTVCSVSDYGVAGMDAEPRQRLFSSAKQIAENYINAANYLHEDLRFRNLALWSYQIEFHRKFVLSVACLLMFFIGAPLGSIIRKGGLGVPLVITVLFFTFYFILSTIGEKTSRGSDFPIEIGMWLSTIVLLPICVFLSWQATEDSSLLSWEKWTDRLALLKKIGFIKRLKSK